MIFTKRAGQHKASQNRARTDKAQPPDHTSSADSSLNNPIIELARFDLPRPEVLIRTVREADLLKLEWHGGEDLRGFYLELWKNHLDQTISVVVADFNGFPIGLAAVYWTGKTTHPHIPDLQSLRVMPVFRRLGIGSRLLQACEEYSRQRGCAHISLSVSIENDKARRLYERLGYVVTGEPYPSAWQYCDAAGQTVRIEETVLDLVKTLTGD